MRDKFCLKAAIPEEKEERGCPSMVKINLLNLTQQALNCLYLKSACSPEGVGKEASAPYYRLQFSIRFLVPSGIWLIY